MMDESGGQDNYSTKTSLILADLPSSMSARWLFLCLFFLQRFVRSFVLLSPSLKININVHLHHEWEASSVS